MILICIVLKSVLESGPSVYGIWWGYVGDLLWRECPRGGDLLLMGGANPHIAPRWPHVQVVGHATDRCISVPQTVRITEVSLRSRGELQLTILLLLARKVGGGGSIAYPTT